MLGTGDACPVAFSVPPLDGTLIVATDGLCNYAKRETLPAIVPFVPLMELPKKLLETVRLRSGELWDDTTIAVCRRRGRVRAVQRYELLE